MSLGRYWPLFIAIQAINAALFLPGVLICLWPALAHDLWIFWNKDDEKKIDAMSWWDAYTYLAWRNPVSNLRHLPGVSKPGRPLQLQQRTKNGVQQHRMVGWLGSTGYPVCQLFWTDGAW